MATVTEAIGRFLAAQRPHHNDPDLIGRWSASMETQLNVAAGKGERLDGRPGVWTDGVEEWWNIRIPKNADSDPEFRDYRLMFPLEVHADGIGCTGWDWSARKSRWVGFDFDSITGHAAGVGISDEELESVKHRAMALPCIEVRRSTGGLGLHLYALFDDDGIPTRNHTEHAALARALLWMISDQTGFSFVSHADGWGQVLWIWHRRMTRENQGLSLIKPAERPLSVDDLPSNWKDHVEVVSGRRSKIQVSGVSDQDSDLFNSLASARKRVPLDAGHQQLIEELLRSGYSTLWIAEHHLLQTHTRALQNLIDDPEKRKALGLVGAFLTNSEGRDPGTPNSFMFPLERSGWRVYRFSPGITEADTWTQDGKGWTSCFFNKHVDLPIAARAAGGAELSGGRGFVFDSVQDALRAGELMGHRLDVPDALHGQEARLKRNKDGRLVIGVKLSKNDARPAKGWVSTKDGWWERVLNIQTEQRQDELGGSDYDNMLRALVTPKGERAGWVARQRNGTWVRQPKDDVRSALRGFGVDPKHIEDVLGAAAADGWTLVNLPFQEEYPGNRQWNLEAPQYRFKPAELPGGALPHHPHWDKVLNHCGQELTPHLKDLEWAVKAGIRTGGDYLLYWLACLLRDPFEPLPFLFFYGPQNSGKSMFHEAAAMLITTGAVEADRCLRPEITFNGELANAVLCYVEETDLSNAGSAAYNKIKNWVTSPSLSIRKMRTDAYQQPNTTHWVQTANEVTACPVFAGDTRITMMHVPLPEQDIPKPLLKQRLIEEAPQFMRTLMGLALPDPVCRLRLPVVSTEQKQRSMQARVPDFVQDVAEFVDTTNRDWEGNSIDLSLAIAAFKSGDPKSDAIDRDAAKKRAKEMGLPVDGRVIRRQLESESPFLRSRGIEYAEVQGRAAKGELISLRRMQADSGATVAA